MAAVAQPSAKRRPGRPKTSARTAEQMLAQLAVLSIADLCQIIGVDRSTMLRKEREGLIPKRRDLGGKLVYLTSEVRALMLAAPTVEGADPDRSRKSREIALARGARRGGAA